MTEEEIRLSRALEVALRNERTMYETLTFTQNFASSLLEENRIIKARLERYEGKKL